MSTATKNVKTWHTHFLRGLEPELNHALIILNQPFSRQLFDRLWKSTTWRACADGGANRLFDTLGNDVDRARFLPDLIKGDLDSIRPDVVQYYQDLGVPVVKDDCQDSTDLMKCVSALEAKESSEGGKQYNIVFLGGLSGRLDQTAHVLSYLQKLRNKRQRVFVVTDDNVGWVLDEGEHEIKIDHDLLGVTCGLLPFGVSSSIISTTGLRWNLTEQESSFDGLLSTSNHLIPGQDVWIKTSKVIWWTAELKNL
ncbi:hypothetical protein D9619_004955 [Psilocybe cf. subviscida]|uniref:Thiamine pyrophosphokinase n=1 Tax=Psilocybe cf. subviscida TaxID=2480587 RepID=A0A8H5BQ21_9AGAR|nr:hypothetical protein D9619_004955 [Psilocybe cf. subviscida]